MLLRTASTIHFLLPDHTLGRDIMRHGVPSMGLYRHDIPGASLRWSESHPEYLEARFGVRAVTVEFTPGQGLSRAQQAWEHLATYLPDHAEAMRQLSGWNIEVGRRGYHDTHIAVATLLPVRVATNTGSDDQGLVELLNQVEGQALFLVLGADDTFNYNMLRQLADARGERHVYLAGNSGHRLRSAYSEQHGVYIQHPTENLMPHQVDEFGERMGARAGLPYLGAVYAPDELPPEGGIPLVALRFEGVTLLTNASDTMQQRFHLRHALKGTTGDLDAWLAERLTQSFTINLQARARVQRERAAETLRHAERNASAHLSNYLTTVREAQTARLLLANEERGMTQTDERGLAMLRRMLDKGVITAASMQDDHTITLNTRHIHIRDARDGIWHDIGPFEMRIDTRTGAYRFKNLKWTMQAGYGVHHPHVNSAAEPCLGTLAEAMPMMMAEQDWPAMIDMGLLYLESVNLEDRHCNLHRWPVVVNPEAVGLTPHGSQKAVSGLALPDVPEGEDDFGEYGTHAFVRRSGVFHFHTGGQRYIDEQGAEVSTDTRISFHRDGDYRPDDYPPNTVLVDEDGTEYRWDGHYSQHFDDEGFNPNGMDGEGFDRDGLNAEGDDRDQAEARELRDDVVSHLRGNGYATYADDYHDRDLREVRDDINGVSYSAEEVAQWYVDMRQENDDDDEEDDDEDEGEDEGELVEAEVVAAPTTRIITPLELLQGIQRRADAAEEDES